MRAEFGGLFGDHLNWPDFIGHSLGNNGSLKCLFRVIQRKQQKESGVVFVALSTAAGLLLKLMRGARTCSRVQNLQEPEVRQRNDHQRSRIWVGHLVGERECDNLFVYIYNVWPYSFAFLLRTFILKVVTFWPTALQWPITAEYLKAPHPICQLVSSHFCSSLITYVGDVKHLGTTSN